MLGAAQQEGLTLSMKSVLLVLAGIVPSGAAAIVAQAAGGGADTIAGASGWAGAGLLGLVLGWLLMIHLPAKDKLFKELIADFRAETNAGRTAFDNAITRVVTEHEKKYSELASAVNGLGRRVERGERGQQA
jgi:hypothetical protein